VQPERHVTRLPDGRVLKGSRPAQRKNAKFWTDISQGTHELLGSVHDEAPARQISQQELERNVVDVPDAQKVFPTTEEPTEDTTEQQGTSSAASRKRRTRSASAVARSKKTTSSSVPKPSQRGFKWPSQS
jgi:membrane-bound lytic murein transglycosylase B